MKKNELAIGIYDSGVGGVSVLAEAARLLPEEHFIYYGDSANAPYGTKSEDEIKKLSLDCGEFLYQKGVKAIVIACNTATSIVVQAMRERYSIPIISMEPAVKPAMQARNSGEVLVFATPATLHQERYRYLLRKLGAEKSVHNIECAQLADMVETGNLSDPHIRAYLCDKLLPFRGKAIDGLVIGCTHYSFLTEALQDVAKKLCGGACEIYDGRFGTSRHLRDVLKENNLLNHSGSRGMIEFYTSGHSHETDIYRHFMKLL